jgi:hypothetical protein
MTIAPPQYKRQKALKTAWCQGFWAFYTEGVMEALKFFSFITNAKKEQIMQNYAARPNLSFASKSSN